MRERPRTGVRWLRRAGLERHARRTGLVAVWTARICLGIVLVLYALSFAGPAPVERVALAYDSPGDVANDAVTNLRAATYRLTIDARRTDGPGDPEPFLAERRTVDNRAHLYSSRVRTGDALANSSIGGERRYGTVTTGYRRAGGPGNNWSRAPDHRYHPSRNAFVDTPELGRNGGTVVANSSATYTVRVTDPEAVAEAVDLPGHTQRREANWTAALTLTIDREDDRLRRANYTYRAPDDGVTVTATYRFAYGTGVGVDRPLATYPPGDELFTRLDRGIHAVESFLRGIEL